MVVNWDCKSLSLTHYIYTRQPDNFLFYRSTSWPAFRLCPKLLLICIGWVFFNLFLNPLFKYKWPVATTTLGSYIPAWPIFIVVLYPVITTFSIFSLCQIGISQAAYTATFVPGLKTGFSITYVNSWKLSFVPWNMYIKVHSHLFL